MEFKINTKKLDGILSVVKEGVGDNRIMPATEYLQMILEEGQLFITATDSHNFITYKESDIEGTDGTVIVKADQLIKLVSRTTKEKISFSLKEKHLEVKGNGVYKLALFDEPYPDYEIEPEGTWQADLKKLTRAFKVNESAIAKEMTMPCLTGYNIGTSSVTTDGIKLCINNTSILDENVLIPGKLADLIQLMSKEKIMIEKEGNKLLFSSDNITVFGSELDGMGEYPDVMPITELGYGNSVTVPKAALISIVDRLSIFVDPFENYGIILAFGEELELSDLKGNSKEVMEYVEHEKTDELVRIVVNINFLQDILKPLTKENIVLEYEEGKPLRVVENEVIMVLSTLEDKEEEE